MSQTFYSGGPGTTGREPFEDSTALGPGPKFGGTQPIDEAAEGTIGSGVGKGVSSGDPSGTNNTYTGGATDQYNPDGEGLVTEPGVVSGTGVAGGFESGLTTGGQDTSGQYGTGADAANYDTGVTGAGDGYAGDGQLGDSNGAPGGDFDRVGGLGQNSAMYERTTDQGPITTGAAGTDKFDTNDSYGGQSYPDVQDTTERAEGKSSGGLMGVLGTSDKDFTGRDRTGGASGAYADSDGTFQNNTTGPGGNSALTGREGNIDNNPVANVADPVGGGRAADNAETGGQKKSFIQKVKELI